MSPQPYSKETQLGAPRVKQRKTLKRSWMKKFNAKREGRAFGGTRDNGMLAWLHELPCAICIALGVEQTTPTEVAETIGGAMQCLQTGGYRTEPREYTGPTYHEELAELRRLLTQGGTE
jgi:hypothetical protein